MADYNYNSSSTGSSMPAYKQPKFDWGRIQGLTQEQMAPGLSGYRRELRNIRAGTYANPMEQSEAYRGAMEGYGEGLGSLQAGASQAATGLYGMEYGGLEKQAQADWQTAMDAWKRAQFEKEQKSLYPSTNFMPEVGGQTKQLGTVYSPGYNKPLTAQHNVIQAGYSPGDLPMPSSPTVYGAGSESAYRQAMAEGWQSGKGRTY